jgi:MFS family permease
MTAASGFATGFWMLFVLRLGVGIGEGALKPAAYALLADLFPPNDLAKPLGIFAVAYMLGSVAALSGGGALYDALLRAAQNHSIPIAPGDAWRWTTTAVGVLGLGVAALSVIFVRDPRRGAPAPSTPLQSQHRISLPAFLGRSMFFFAPFTVAMILFVLWQAGFMGWLAPFFMRTYGWTVGQVGQGAGILNLGAGLLGAPVGVWLSDVVRKRTGYSAPVAVAGLAVCVTAPLLVIGSLLPNGVAAMACFGAFFVAAGAATVVTPMVFTSTAPPHLRARMIAVSNLTYGVVGQSTGGLIFASFTEHVAGGPMHLNITFAVLTAVLMALLAVALWFSARAYRGAVALADQEA